MHIMQMGSFVPASSAKVGVVDRLFARIGASDNVAKHMSTFHMEMTETANILSTATPRSFVILDEIGMRWVTLRFLPYLLHGQRSLNLKPPLKLFVLTLKPSKTAEIP